MLIHYDFCLTLIISFDVEMVFNVGDDVAVYIPEGYDVVGYFKGNVLEVLEKGAQYRLEYPYFEKVTLQSNFMKMSK